jgi:flotillin
VREVVASDLSKFGMRLLSYTILDMSDKSGYLQALGARALGEVKRDARIGVATAKSEADQMVAICAAQTARVKWQTAIETAQAKGRHTLCVHDARAAVVAAQVEAAVSYKNERLTQQRTIAELQGRVNRTRMKWQVEIAKAEVRRRELSLAAEVGMLAHMDYVASTIVATASSEARIVQAHASAYATVTVGHARASAIEAMGRAVAEVMELKAEAYTSYGPAALLDRIVEGLVPLAQAYVQPLARIQSATLITDDKDGGVGHALVTHEVRKRHVFFCDAICI